MITIISEFEIRDELEKLKVGEGILFVTEDYVVKQDGFWEYWYDTGEYQDMPDVIQDEEIIIDNILKHALAL